MYKGYREQCLDCDKYGNRFLLTDCEYINKDVLICIKYKTYCHSEVCLQERKDKGEVIIQPLCDKPLMKTDLGNKKQCEINFLQPMNPDLKL